MANEPTDIAKYIGTALANPVVVEQVAAGFAPWLDRAQFAGQCAIAAADPNLRAGKPSYAAPHPDSLLKALFKCGQLGLLPGPSRHVSLIVAQSGDVQVRPEFRGWTYIWAIGGWDVTAHLVHVEDVFQFDAIGPDEFEVLRHEYDVFGDRPFTDKTLRGGYVRGVSRTTGEVRYRFVTLAKILSNRAKAETSYVWAAHFAEMAQKTLLHVAMSRGWFPTPAAIAAALQGMGEVDHEAAGVVMHRPAPAPRLTVAERIAALAAPLPASAPQEALPAPAPVAEAAPALAPPAVGWVSENDRKEFCAELSRGGVDYNNVARWAVTLGRPRPSAMTWAQRNTLVDYLHTDAGMARYKAFLTSEPQPADHSYPTGDADAGFFTEPSAAQEVP